jgi:hypothetical protein
MKVMEGVPFWRARTLLAIKEALVGTGVEFIGISTENPGVRLKTKPQA